MNKIQIKGTIEHLERISIFLDINHIKHNIENKDTPVLQEIEETIDWPL